MNPITVRWADDVVVITLDTPGSDFNVFSHDAATELLAILGQVDPNRVRALIFRSDKPASFINGVGLMMAGTAQTTDDIPRMTGTVTRAYRAMRELPIPSLAAIRGNCYGCGVEFALHCDYRLAAHTYDTHFYMTEIAEYLFVPAFGSSQDLPHLIGLESAADALLWGQRWPAPEAARRGLIDAWFEDSEFDAGVDRFVADLLARGAPKRSPPAKRPWGLEHDDVERRTRARIAALPPDYHAIYEECFELMVHAARRPHAEEQDYQRELDVCGRSVLRPIAKSALSIFFIRRLALLHSLRDYELPDTTRIIIAGDSPRLAALRDDLAARRARGLAIMTTEAAALAPSDIPAIHLAPFRPEAPGRADARSNTVETALELLTTSLHQYADLVLYAPLLDARIPVIEISRSTAPIERARALFAIFHRAGFEPILSRSGRAPVLNELLTAYLGPLVAYVLAGGNARDVHASLRLFGFVRSPADIVRALPRERLASLLAEGHGITPPSRARLEPTILALAESDAVGGHLDTALLDAVLISLLAFATRSLERHTLGHPSVVDILAREVLDFPLGHGSLCRYLTRGRTADIAVRGAGCADLLPPGAAARLTDFVERGRDFYQTPSAQMPARPAQQK